jgi:hypothetical protein
MTHVAAALRGRPRMAVAILIWGGHGGPPLHAEMKKETQQCQSK